MNAPAKPIEAVKQYRFGSYSHAQLVWWIIAAGFAVRLIVATWNGFWGPSLGAEIDALEFHQRAAGVADGSIQPYFDIGNIYFFALGYIYKITGTHVFIGSVISCLAWLWSSVLLLKLLRMLESPPVSVALAMLIFAFIPSSICYTSVTMREPFELAFMMVFIMSALNSIKGIDNKNAVIMVLAGAILGLLHGAFIIFVIVISAVVLLDKIRRTSFWRHLPQQGLSVLLLLALIGFSTYIFANHSYGRVIFAPDKNITASPGAEGGGLIDFSQGVSSMFATADSRQNSLERGGGRTLYPDFPTPPVLENIYGRAIISLIQYMLEPFPWHVNATLDIVVLAENLLRALLIILALVSIFRSHGQKQISLLFIFLAYCCLEGLWALGTGAWGTAIRHHIPAVGLLLAVAFSSSFVPEARMTTKREESP